MKVFKRLLLIVFVLGIAAAFFLNSTYKKMLAPVDASAASNEILVEIAPGTGTEGIAQVLSEHKLIRSALAFRVLARVRGFDQHFIAGQYNLNQAMSAEELAEALIKGEVHSDTVWFTIPEGFTVEQIAQRLEEEGLAERSAFLALAETAPPALVERYPEIAAAKNEHTHYQLEGYLFPDTYEVERRASAEAIITLMTERLFAVIGEEGLERLKGLNLTLHELLTLSSIVEREARVDKERALIAGVFYNRIGIGQRLESCATVQYVLGENKEFLSYRDLETPSPYNTYLHSGLPPGPIAASGQTSIMAALYPEESDYYYFNSKYDGTGEHYFSKTLAEHDENVNKAEARLP